MQVLELGNGEYIGTSGGFIVLGFDTPDLEVSYVEGNQWYACIEDPDQVEQYKRAFDVLRADALSPEQSRTLMRRRVKDFTCD